MAGLRAEYKLSTSFVRRVPKGAYRPEATHATPDTLLEDLFRGSATVPHAGAVATS